MESVHFPVRTLIGLSAAALLSLYGTLEFYGEQSDRNKVRKDPYAIERQMNRFEALRREVPPDTVLGYVSDIKPESVTVLITQFAVAPRLLVGNAPHDLVLGDFSKPQDYAEFGRARGLTLTKQFPGGVVLFRKSR